MDAELLELQRQFTFVQQAKPSIRLSERNVVELIQKLHELKIIDFDLLHTVSGKEYITHDQLRHEMVTEITEVGRVSLIDLAEITGVDLYHVEKLAQLIVSDDPELMLVQGEIITDSYWDTVAEETNERLQECSQIGLAELAAQLNVGSELIASKIEPRLGTLVKGRLEGGQLYTPAYVTRVSAMVRGAARGMTVATTLSVLWSSLRRLLQEMDGATGVAVEGVFFQTMFNKLVKDGEVFGSLRAGVYWTPTVFSNAQKEYVDTFLSQNSFICYDSLQKLGISQPIQYLQSRYPDGVPLVTVFVNFSLIEMLDAAVEDAIESGSWIDCLSVLPTSFGLQDAFRILAFCPSVQSSLKNNIALSLGESYIFSSAFIKGMFERVEKEMHSICLSGSTGSILYGDLQSITGAKLGHHASRLSKSTGNVDDVNQPATDKGVKKKRGKSSQNTIIHISESSQYDQDTPHKTKKSQRKGKDASSQGIEAKASVKTHDDKVPKEENNSIPSNEWIMKNILLVVPEFEDQDNAETIFRLLADHLKPMLMMSLKERQKELFTENAAKMRKIIDSMQKKLDESLNMQLYEKALDLFEDDQSASVVLHKYLIRTATSLVDELLFNLDLYNKLRNGLQVDVPENSESFPFTRSDRISLAKSLPGSLKAKALAVVESLDGKRVETFVTTLSVLAEESGLILKKIDKKTERALLHSYRKDLMLQISAETDPVSLLPKVVSLLYIQSYNKALQAPGRALSLAVSRLKDKLADSAYKVLMDYHTATVSLLALISASTGNEEDCSADRIMIKRELLETMIPSLKNLALKDPVQK